MNLKLKRFLYYWRLPIYCFILWCLLLFLGNVVPGEAGQIFSVIWLFDCVFFVFALVRAIWIRIKDAFYCWNHDTTIDDYSFAEFEFIKSVIDWFGYDISTFMDLPGSFKLRYIVFRVIGTFLIIWGSVKCYLSYGSNFLIAVFTLVIIAGATLWVMSNPRKYNENVTGVRMVPFDKDLDNEKIFKQLLNMPTSLGIPTMANVLGFKKPIIVYGSKEDDYVYVVYKAKFSKLFYVSCIISESASSDMAEPKENASVRSEGINQEFEYYLEEILTVVENAVNLAI